jgi:putative transposase
MRWSSPSAVEKLALAGVDQDGYVLDEVMQVRRDTKAAKRLLVRLLKKQGLAPKRIVTDKLRSYGAAKRDVMPAVEHRSHKSLNNRAENSHLLAAKTRTSDAGLTIRRRLATIYHGVFSGQKSFHPVAPQALRPRNPHSSDLRHGAVEGRDRHSSLSLTEGASSALSQTT